MATPTPYQGMRFFKCCLGCLNRTPACSDTCVMYMMAKAEKWAEREMLKKNRSQYRKINGK